MIVYPEATDLKTSNYYLRDISTFIERSTTAFKINTGDLTTRIGMFVGCSSGKAAADVWTGAVGRTFEKCVGRERQHTIGDNAQCYGLIMFELNVHNAVAGGEVMNGKSPLLSPEHTVTIPLSDYPFTDCVRARGLNCGGGSATPRADGRFVVTSDSTVTTETIPTHLCLCRATTARKLTTPTALGGRAPRTRSASARSATRLVAAVVL